MVVAICKEKMEMAKIMVLLRLNLDFVKVNKRIMFMIDEILPRRILLIRSLIENTS